VKGTPLWVALLGLLALISVTIPMANPEKSMKFRARRG
jgi:hypothetical protein